MKKKQNQYLKKVKCPQCNGKGILGGKTCPKCKGTGEVDLLLD